MKLITTIFLLLLSVPTFASLPACGTKLSNGGFPKVIVHTTFGVPASGDVQGWRDVAASVRENYLGAPAYDTQQGVNLEFQTVIGGNAFPIASVLVSFDGETSFAKAVLRQQGIDLGVPDPASCDPHKNPTNTPVGDIDLTWGDSGDSGIPVEKIEIKGPKDSVYRCSGFRTSSLDCS